MSKHIHLFGTNLLISFIIAKKQSVVILILQFQNDPNYIHRYIIFSKNREFGIFFRTKLKSLKPSASKPFCKMA